MQEIKGCPYCGSNNIRIEVDATPGRIFGFYALCETCGVQGAIAVEKKDAIEKWNFLPRKSDIERLEKLSALQTDNIGYLNESIRQLNKESDWLADALVSPFINPADHKDREYWRNAARKAVEDNEKM